MFLSDDLVVLVCCIILVGVLVVCYTYVSFMGGLLYCNVLFVNCVCLFY